MTLGQRYFFILAPAFILLAFFFGMKTFLAIFGFVYLIYYGDEHDWSVFQFAWRMTCFVVLIFGYVCSLPTSA